MIEVAMMTMEDKDHRLRITGINTGINTEGNKMILHRLK